MSPRLFGILMLLFASAIVGASVSLNRNGQQTFAEVSIADTQATSKDEPRQVQPERKAEPAIRVILPSPYEIRTN